MSKTTHKKASKPEGKSKDRAKDGTKDRTKDKSRVAAKASAKTAAGAGSTARVKSGAKAGAKTSAAKTSATKTPIAKTPATKSAVTKSSAARPPKTASPRQPAPAGGGLTVGSKAPAFRLPRDGGATLSLDSFAGRKLVLFFYPRAGTPGCTKEAMDFSRLSDSFAALDTAVVGISADPPRAQESFRDKHDLTMPLLSNETHAMLESFGVWGDKSLYGKMFKGVIRTTVLLGPDARVLQIWRNVKVDGHAEAVLHYVENL